MSSITHSAAFGWQAQFLSAFPAITSHACFTFRALPAEQREEAVQEALAAACVAYHDLFARRRSHLAHHPTIARYSILHVRNGRHVGGRQDATRDVMSAAARRRGVSVLSLACAANPHGSDWAQMVIAEKQESVPAAAAFRIDFACWLGAQTDRDRGVIESLIRGENPSSIAERLGLTRGRISQLRRRFERDWFRFQGERPPKRNSPTERKSTPPPPNPRDVIGPGGRDSIRDSHHVAA